MASRAPWRASVCSGGRKIAAAALLVSAVACCPVPATGGTSPTAFDAVVAAFDDGGWVAQTRDGTRYRVAGDAPAAVGTRVYLRGSLGQDGTLVVDRTDAITSR